MSKGNVTLGVMLAVVLMLLMVVGSTLLTGQARSQAEEKTTESFVEGVTCSVFPFVPGCEAEGSDSAGVGVSAYQLDVVETQDGTTYDDFEPIERRRGGDTEYVASNEDVYTSSPEDGFGEDIMIGDKRFAVRVRTASGNEQYGNGGDPVTLRVDHDESSAFLRKEGDNAWALQDWSLYEAWKEVDYDDSPRCLSTDSSDCAIASNPDRTESVEVDVQTGGPVQLAVQIKTAEGDDAGTDDRVDLCSESPDGSTECWWLDHISSAHYGGEVYNDFQPGRKDSFFQSRATPPAWAMKSEEKIVVSPGDEVYLKIRGNDALLIERWRLYVLSKEIDYREIEPYSSQGFICLSSVREGEWCGANPNNADSDTRDRTPTVEIGA